jgi:hypothetical protein
MCSILELPPPWEDLSLKVIQVTSNAGIFRGLRRHLFQKDQIASYENTFSSMHCSSWPTNIRSKTRARLAATSLDLLLSRSTTLPQSSTSTPAAIWLQQASASIISHLLPGNSRNPGYALLSEDHEARIPKDEVLHLSTTSVHLHGRDDFLRFRAQLTAENPGFAITILDVVFNVDEEGGKARVYVTVQKSHYSMVDMKPHESVALLEWRRNRKDWFCIKSRFLHGYTHEVLE